MEAQESSLLSTFQSQSFGARSGAYENIGGIPIDLDDLPTPDPLAFPLFSFIATDATHTVTWQANGSRTVNWGDGNTETVTGTGKITYTHTYTGLTAGDAISVSINEPFPARFFTNDNNANSIGDLPNVEFYFDGIANCEQALQLKGVGITKPVKFNGIPEFEEELILRGNSIPGPLNVTVSGTTFIEDNRFTGEMPAFANNNARFFQAENNAFTGDIHDISGFSNLEFYFVYAQDDGKNYSKVNPKVMLTGEIPDLSGCTSLISYHIGAGLYPGGDGREGFVNDFTLSDDFDVPNQIEIFWVENSSLNQSEVDRILEVFAQRVGSFTNPNSIRLQGNAAPSSAGLANAALLIDGGWDVYLPEGSGAIPYVVKGIVVGNASNAVFSNGRTIGDELPYDVITTVEAGGNVNLTYSSQNEFDEFRIISGTVGSSNVDDTNFQLTNVQSNIECEIERTD